MRGVGLHVDTTAHLLVYFTFHIGYASQRADTKLNGPVPRRSRVGKVHGVCRPTADGRYGYGGRGKQTTYEHKISLQHHARPAPHSKSSRITSELGRRDTSLPRF